MGKWFLAFCILFLSSTASAEHLGGMLVGSTAALIPGVTGAARAFPPDAIPGVAMLKGTSKKGNPVYCGVSLIEGCGLTAWHCLDSFREDAPIELFIGSNEKNATFKTTVMKSEIIGDKLPHNDFAVVKFKNPPPSNSTFNRDKLATEKKLEKGIKAVVVGYGHNRSEEVPGETVDKSGKKQKTQELVDVGVGERRGGFSTIEGLGKLDKTGFVEDLDAKDHYVVATRGPQIHSYGDSGAPLIVGGMIVGVYSSGTGSTFRSPFFAGPDKAATEELKYAAYSYVPDHVEDIKNGMDKLKCAEHTPQFMLTEMEQTLAKHFTTEKGKAADKDWMNDLPEKVRNDIADKYTTLLNPAKGAYQLFASQKKDAGNYQFVIENDETKRQITMNFNLEKSLLSIVPAK